MKRLLMEFASPESHHMSHSDVVILARSFKAGSVGSAKHVVASATVESAQLQVVADATAQLINPSFPALKDRAKVNSPLRGEAIHE